MTIRVALRHVTRYRYDRAIRLGPQTVRLRPAPHCRTKILSYDLKVAPRQHFLNWQQDPQSNWLARVMIPEPTDHFSVTVDLIAEMAVINPFDFFLEPEAEQFPFVYAPDLAEELRPYLSPAPGGPLFRAYLLSVPRARRQTVQFLFDLNARVQRDIAYLVRMEPGIQTPETTLTNASGSCRDSAWLLVQLLRHLGLAARFASGYLIQLKPDVESLDGPSGAAADFTDLHAWCEVYLPGAGWIGLDPTSGLFAGEGHIPLACAANPTQAAPISGALEKAGVAFDFEMQVARVHEPARVTRPYTGAQWAAIDALGDKVDAMLAAGDVRLTMGGEPTFVSIDDMQSAEWNTEALGPAKRGLADTLIRRLRARFAPDGLLHYGQGKWYPGESLPRWAFALYWRADGVPMWRDEKLIARENPKTPVRADAPREMAHAIARRLGLRDDYVQPVFEDPLHHVGREMRLPANIDPFEARLEEEAERVRLARVLRQGLRAPAGFVLPLQPGLAPDSWQSERWRTRDERLYLIPGDSPIGFRLPLDSLPYVVPAARPFVVAADAFGAVPPLPARDATGQAYRDEPHRGETHSGDAEAQAAMPTPETIDPMVRTSLAVEMRDGVTCAFMPPVENAAQYLALLQAVEDSAAALGVPVHVEGYPPPHDARINVIKVTPDPGVIEVNIHPAAHWREQVHITRALYDEARATRLGTEKFMIDGRHTGTGGGNHIVLGARAPADSPFLRRPDLLTSMIAYWQNHPSLSYLFSGLFIGPTSQAPRIDEGRHDALHEMEIAFGEVPPRGAANIPPWLVDRIFRDLMTDMTGNTHRAEICIDKLYSPDTASGRLGLVELRGFEMPPHADMSLAQQLLIRALVARFWTTPYRRKLVPWGTVLNDRFMLPHHVWEDFCDVTGDLNEAGFAFDPAWFAPHWAFRFPRLGGIETDGVRLELRTALEPWNVMGEDGAPGGTARYVDSSVERIQLRAEGLVPGRHIVGVNGYAAPMQAVSPGVAVAGVRYRAWQPPRCLHPTIAPDAPLLVEIWDTWRGRSLGGCRYHVAHPGGRSHDTFPVNGYEAEGRRLARFSAHGMTGGTTPPRAVRPHPDFPNTLDLRRAKQA